MSIQASSKFGRSGQRDDRRRRLMTDEGLADEPAEDQAGADPPRRRRSKRRTAQHYGNAEFLNQARRVVDLVPLRLLIIWPLFAAGLATIAGIEALFASMPEIAGGARLAAFDLAGTGNLAAWFSSLMMLAATWMALMVYSVRCHRVDDYRGRYRVWLWTALCWFVAASDQAANLHQGVQQMMVRLSGTALYGDGDLWWIIAYLLLATAIGSRLLLDMWECWLSTAVLLLAAATYLATALLRLGVVVCASAAEEVMAISGTEMAGNLLVLLAMALHARHVLLDAHGLLQRKRPAAGKPPVDKRAKVDDNTASGSSQPAVSASGGKTLLVDPPHSTPAPQFARSAPAVSAASNYATSDSDDDDSTDADAESAANRKLTKAERKALKQRLLDERRQRDQQKASRWGR